MVIMHGSKFRSAEQVKQERVQPLNNCAIY